MHRVIAGGNKIIQRKVEDNDWELHKKRLQNMIPSVDTSSPLTYEIGYNFNKKKLQLMEDKYIEIERENRILLEKITTIMQKNQQPSQQHTQLSPIQRSFHKKSLNEKQRKEQLIKITVENQNILKKLKNPKSDYSVRQFLLSWRQNEKYKNNISEYPDVINNMNDINNSNKQEQDLNQTQIEGKRINPQSAKISNNQFSDERFQNQSGNLNKLSNNSTNNNKNFIKNYTKSESFDNKLNKDDKIIAKKSKKIGLNYFIIQISLNNGIFKITADNVEHPVSKILEMSENDGLYILQKCFQNSTDQLIENLRISGNNLFIKGVDETRINNNIKKQIDQKKQQSIEVSRKNQIQKEITETQINLKQKGIDVQSNQENSQKNQDEKKIINEEQEIKDKNINQKANIELTQISNKIQKNIIDIQQTEEIYEEEEFEPEGQQ